MTVRILQGHVLDKLRGLADESVHCVVTSPPYFGLRDYGIEPQVWGGEDAERCGSSHWVDDTRVGYGHDWGDERLIPATTHWNSGGVFDPEKRKTVQEKSTNGTFCRRCGAWRGSLGLEPTLDLYLDHMVEICREIRRVLRKDGTFWLNLGSSYAGSWGAQSREETPATLSRNQINNHPKTASHTGSIRAAGIKPKDDMLIPSRLAIRLCDDGWWVRSDICWAKRSPMPESCTDRPTSAWEHVFLLTKSAQYFYDAEAVKEEVTGNAHERGKGENPKRMANEWGVKTNSSFIANELVSSRNMRNFWLLGPEPFPEAHFATFPTEIPRRAILAGTSERGVCPKCGAGWERTVATRTETNRRGGYQIKDGRIGGDSVAEKGRAGQVDVQTIGWRQTCSCDAGSAVPATCLDPFAGAGTTLLVADRLGRNCIGIELSPAYAAMSERRIRDDAGMFAEIAAE